MTAVAPGSRYGDKQRREAVALILILGDWEKVSKALRLPARTLRDWRNSEWWHPLTADVRREKEAELDTGLSRIIDKAFVEIEERLQLVHRFNKWCALCGQIEVAPLEYHGGCVHLGNAAQDPLGELLL